MARRPSGRRQGAWAWSSATGTRFRILPVSTETRYRLRRFPLRAKKAMASPLGSKSIERPATNSSFMVMFSNWPV